MDCKCDECRKEQYELNRIRILTKLKPEELVIINKDFSEQKFAWFIVGLGVGILAGGLFILLSVVGLIA